MEFDSPTKGVSSQLVLSSMVICSKSIEQNPFLYKVLYDMVVVTVANGPRDVRKFFYYYIIAVLKCKSKEFIQDALSSRENVECGLNSSIKSELVAFINAYGNAKPEDLYEFALGYFEKLLNDKSPEISGPFSVYRGKLLFKCLNSDKLLCCFNDSEVIRAKKNETVVKAGDSVDGLYCIYSGSFIKVSGRSSRKTRPISTYNSFGIVGDRERLLGQKEFEENIVCIADGELLKMSSTVFSMTLEQYMREKVLKFIPLVSSVPALKLLDEDEKLTICYQLEEASYSTGTDIINEGSVRSITASYFIRSGLIQVNRSIPKKTSKKLGKNKYFSVNSGIPSLYSAKCIKDVSVACLEFDGSECFQSSARMGLMFSKLMKLS